MSVHRIIIQTKKQKLKCPPGEGEIKCSVHRMERHWALSRKNGSRWDGSPGKGTINVKKVNTDTDELWKYSKLDMVKQIYNPNTREDEEGG